jgi:hypothetical protein
MSKFGGFVDGTRSLGINMLWGLTRKGRSTAVARAAFALTAVALAAGMAGPVSAAPAGPEPTPLDVVVAVDESGSLSPADVTREIEAASTIAQGGLNERTRVTVLGFGSDNGGQSPVDNVCRPTIVNTQVNLQYLADCVRRLHRRTPAQGNDTDHVAALSQALAVYGSGSPPGSIRAVFLLTDGNLDVRHSPKYGNGDRNAEARRQLLPLLANARDANVQIWPLGFGSRIDKAALDRFAAGGAQKGCDIRSVSRPQARVVHGSADVIRSLEEAYAFAACAGLSATDSTDLPGGESRSLHVAIPVIATDGTITVTKGDPRVRVDYFDPRHRAVPSSGAFDGSTFTRSGENGATEGLRIRDPQNGTWTVKLTAPPGLQRQLVSATALWQGAVRTSVVVEPPTAQPGQRLTVRLSLLTRNGAVTNARSFDGLIFTVTATGAGLASPQDVVVRDDGKDPDDRAGDGRYAGTFTAPGGEGNLVVTGTVAGPGIHAQELPVTVPVSATGALLQGRVQFGGGARVHPGSAVPGTVQFTNGTGKTVRARLALDGPASSAATVRPAQPFDLPSGASTKDFTVDFGRQAKLGGTSVAVKVVDDADPTTVYANGQLTVTIRRPPGFAERNRWAIAGVLLLAVALAVLLALRRRAHRARVDVRGLYAGLRRDGDAVGAELKAPSTWSDEFAFVIRDLDGPFPRLDYPRPGDRTYRARRGADGAIVVRTPEGKKYEVAVGGPGEPLANGNLLTFRDVRNVRPRRPARAPAAGAAGANRAAGNGAAANGAPPPSAADTSSGGPGSSTSPSSSSTSSDDDMWL